MKKNILIAGILIVLAAVGIGVVVAIPFLQKEDDGTKTIKPKPEPIALLPKKEPPKTPIRPTSNEKKSVIEPVPKTPVKVEPEPKKKEDEPKKIDVKIEPKVEAKKDDKKPAAAKIIAVGDDLIKLNDPDGEYTVETLNRAMQLKLIGTIKTLKIAGANDRSVLDASDLEAVEIIFTGNLNSGSKVILGKAQTLKIRDINDKSTLDASALDARAIVLEGAVNSGSTVKLHAASGSALFIGDINGDAQLTIVAKDVEFRGAINGGQAQLDVTLTKNGSLKLTRVNGGVRLHYSKASASDPEPRIDLGEVDARAQVRMVPPRK
ncbi:MAG: hypothetical protein EXR98_20785 [Gemmataceae bacterium]|nr:hypothetical protein [Gemmataceae bacterium]